jgi:uncharacterized linocin/CFP29 family protein
MDHLLRHLAPISADVWAQIDDEARTRLAPALGGRKLVDFNGPFGWQHSATSTGRVSDVISAPETGLIARSRDVIRVVEVRADFTLNRSELDSAARGAVDADYGPLDDAAAKIASNENHAILDGWDEAGIVGAGQASPLAPLTRDDNPARLAQQVAAAIATLQHCGIGGPYGLALDTDTWIAATGGSDIGGSPLFAHLHEILDGPVEWAPGISGCVVLSLRGGDFLYESGQDIAVGYASHTESTVSFYLEETFTFRVATPEASIRIL